jgi:hypothetical protein
VDRWAKVFVSIKVTAAKHSTRLWHNKIPEFYL